MRATAVSTGSATRCLRASTTTAAAVATPSATCVDDARIASSDSPRPRRTPTVRLRDRLTKQVSMMSPTPDRPDSVTGSAPMRSASHRISLHPCATSAAMALLPSSSPSTMPAAMASTFLSAPAISTPMTSVLVLTRRLLLANSRCTRTASFTSSDAATMAVGRPCMSSMANDGPESTARGCLRPSAVGMSSLMLRQLPISSPLDRHSMGVVGAMCSRSAASALLLCCTGIACTT